MGAAYWTLGASSTDAGGPPHAPVPSCRGAENMALLRRLTLNLLAQDRDIESGVKGKRERAAWDPDCLPQLLHLSDA